ncbi:MAG: asparaginase [SAR202 cluster bacterium]|nr:asparaginase [SAR202 cluster bacterium]
MPAKPNIVVFGTGGTIAAVSPDRMDFTRYGDVGRRMPVAENLERLPEAKEIANLRAEDLYRTSSGEIGPKEWLNMARRINETFARDKTVDGIVLTHGTGTMEESAYFLNLTVKSNKPVVMTGSMRPASAIGTDADVNLYNAIKIAASPQARGMGVVVCLNHQIHSAREVTKSDPLRVETFKTHEFGILGYADSDGEVRFYRAPVRKHTTATPFEVNGLTDLPRVDIVPLYAGGDDLLINAVRKNKSAGLVLSGVGGGSGSKVQRAAALAAVKEGMAVALSSRTSGGRVVMTPEREEEGFISADDLRPLKARILLMLALSMTKDRKAIQRMFYEM